MVDLELVQTWLFALDVDDGYFTLYNCTIREIYRQGISSVRWISADFFEHSIHPSSFDTASTPSCAAD